MVQAERMAEFVYGNTTKVQHICPSTCLMRSIVDVPGIFIVEDDVCLCDVFSPDPALCGRQGIVTKLFLAAYVGGKPNSALGIGAVARALVSVAAYPEVENRCSIPTAHRLFEGRIPQTIGTGYVHVKGRRRRRPSEVEKDIGIDRRRKDDGQARHQPCQEY